MDGVFLALSVLAAVGQPGLVVAVYNAFLARLHESVVKKVTALAALPGGWLAAGGLIAGGILGYAPSWFVYEGGGVGDAVLSAYLFASAVGGAAVLVLIATNPRRRVRPAAELGNHSQVVPVPRSTSWNYSPVKRAVLALAQPVNQLTEIEVVTKEVALPNLPAAFDGLRMVQLSDFHIDRALEDEYYRGAVRVANDQKGDLIVLTGDYISRASHIARVAPLLRGLEAALGAFYVRGNHDFWTRPGEVRRQLDGLGYTCLDNRAKVFSRDGRSIALVGVEHPYGEKISRWDRVFTPDLPACRIVLTHTPDIVSALARAGCDLVVAGHTHGGQVQFPLVGATLVPSMFGRRYASGWKVVGKTLLYTNRGLGAFFPVRVLCRPEITVFVLRSPEVASTRE